MGENKKEARGGKKKKKETMQLLLFHIKIFKKMKTKTLTLASLLLLSILFLFGFLSKDVQKDSVSSLFNNQKTTIETKPLSKLLKKGTPISILIDKSDYTLQVFTADTLVKTYPVVLGGNPVDDKLRQGDSCTPEGSFHIVSKYPHRSWSKFIWLNYPTKESWKKHNKAKKDGLIPKNATIGGEIGIHGVPKGSDSMINRGINWTLGCISLTNSSVNEIYPFIDKKTVITIQR